MEQSCIETLEIFEVYQHWHATEIVVLSGLEYSSLFSTQVLIFTLICSDERSFVTRMDEMYRDEKIRCTVDD